MVDYKNLNEKISNTDWSSKLKDYDTKTAYKILVKEYDKLCENAIPSCRKEILNQRLLGLRKKFRIFRRKKFHYGTEIKIIDGRSDHL